MIIQLLCAFVFKIVNLLLSPFDAISFICNTNIFDTVMQYLNVVFYVLPIENFLPIIGFIIATMGLRIVISILKTIWAILPLL